MRYWLMGSILFIVALLQVTLVPFLVVWGVKPNIVLVLISVIALLMGSKAGLTAGIMGGAFLDLLSGQYLGLFTVSLAVTGYLVGTVEQKVFKDYLLVPLGGAFVASLLQTAMEYGLLRVAGVPVGLLEAVLDVALPFSVYNALWGPILFAQSRKFRLQQRLTMKAN